MPRTTDRFVESIAPLIRNLRGYRVILDSDLATIYGVPTKRLNEQVKRNQDRFPGDFSFLLTAEEHAQLRSQFATSSRHGGRRSRPMAFTEHGAIMLASVLNSPRAVEAGVFVVRAFVRLREYISPHREPARKLTQMERKVAGHDSDIQHLIAAIRQLMASPEPKDKKIGFRVREGTARYKVAGRRNVKANDGSMPTARMPE